MARAVEASPPLIETVPAGPVVSRLIVSRTGADQLPGRSWNWAQTALTPSPAERVTACAAVVYGMVVPVVRSAGEPVVGHVAPSGELP